MQFCKDPQKKMKLMIHKRYLGGSNSKKSVKRLTDDGLRSIHQQGKKDYTQPYLHTVWKFHNFAITQFYVN